MSDQNQLSAPNSPAASLSADVAHAGYDALSPAPTLVSPGSPMVAPTRTVAIIKPHALDHRFDIEHRITEASFEIVKERQMEFDVESDPDTLFELFGEDANAFAEGPVWVYVLERRRAIEVWNTIMGDPDPDVARRVSPNSLRALYGISAEQNGIMGSPDVETAEIQIASLFASSPPFPTSDLPEEYPGGGHLSGSLRSVSSALLASLRRDSTGGNSASSPNGKPVFKARALPATTHAPSIAPRTTRAADLRAGILPPDARAGPRAPPTKERLGQIFANVPGHKRAASIAVASTAPPVVAPRMTRAAALRLGQAPPEARPLRSRTTGAEPGAAGKTFDGVPGHKRRESIAVASTKAPTVAPRLNKSAALRAQKEAAPPSSYQFRAPTVSRTPSLSRSTSRSQLTPSRPASAQALTSPAPSRPSISRATSSTFAAPRPTTASRTPSAASTPRTPSTPSAAKSPPPASAAKPTLKPRPSSLGMPTLAPRQNKSAMLRAAKMAAAPTPQKQKAVYMF
ncbi:hypothetical protein FA95DRAFT_1514107 [Auriscalpium vulgare]|uniref:Uncharacterized protein n=1 Tax=Auriscalpium vulgare TaxID=40419 RepID=A0ACB8S2K8_9AGAM|nr:hypothetical protein FA95DRAFT_1514107 [Auriscalpium vulgare]